MGVREKGIPTNRGLCDRASNDFCPPGAELRLSKEVSAQTSCFCAAIGRRERLKPVFSVGSSPTGSTISLCRSHTVVRVMRHPKGQVRILKNPGHLAR